MSHPPLEKRIVFKSTPTHHMFPSHSPLGAILCHKHVPKERGKNKNTGLFYSRIEERNLLLDNATDTFLILWTF